MRNYAETHGNLTGASDPKDDSCICFWKKPAQNKQTKNSSYFFIIVCIKSDSDSIINSLNCVPVCASWWIHTTPPSLCSVGFPFFTLATWLQIWVWSPAFLASLTEALWLLRGTLRHTVSNALTFLVWTNHTLHSFGCLMWPACGNVCVQSQWIQSVSVWVCVCWVQQDKMFLFVWRVWPT